MSFVYGIEKLIQRFTLQHAWCLVRRHGPIKIVCNMPQTGEEMFYHGTTFLRSQRIIVEGALEAEGAGAERVASKRLDGKGAAAYLSAIWKCSAGYLR